MLTNLSFFILTILDGMFVGNGVGTDALGAVSLSMPYVNLIWALTTLITIGGVTVASVRLGRGDDAGASRAFMHALSMTGVLFALLSSLGMAFSRQIAGLLGANDTYRQMVSDYVFWYSLFLLPAALAPCLNNFARNDGDPSLSVAMAVTCTVSNIFLDWLLVFPLKRGVAGAAMATGFANVMGLLVVSTHYLRRKGRLRFIRFRPEPAQYLKILIRGLPEMISQFANPVTAFCMNRVLIRHLGNDAVNAYAVITYASALFASLMWGLTSGLQPLYGRSYGARDDAGLRFYFRTGQKLALIGGTAVFLLTFVIGRPLCRIYGADPAVVPIVAGALPKYCLNYVFAASSAVIAAYLFSTKRTQYAVAINTCRSLVFNALCISLLPLLLGYDFVWYTVAVAEAVCMGIALTLCRISEKNGIVYR